MRGIGEHALRGNLDQRCAIDALHVLHDVDRRWHRRHRGKKGAHVAEVGDAHRQERAVGVERKLGGKLMIAAVTVRDKASRTFVSPFHRPAQCARCVQDANIFGKRRCLHPERAADVAGQDADLPGLDLENIRHVSAQAENTLRGDVQRKASAGLVVNGDRGARLHRIHNHAAVDELYPCDMRGSGERGRDLFAIAVVIVQCDVVRRFIIKKRGLGACGLLRSHHRGQGIDLDLDCLGGVFCLQQCLGDNKGDGIADETHFVGRQRRPRRLLHGRAVAVLERHDAFERAVTGEIGAGIDPEHARHIARRRRVDAFDHAMGNAAADHHCVGFARELDVVGIAAPSPHQDRIFAARHRLPDPEFHHRKGLRIGLQIHQGMP